MISTIQTAAAAFVVEVGNALVSFSVFGQNQATVIENAAVGLLALGLAIGQAIENHGKSTAAAK